MTSAAAVAEPRHWAWADLMRRAFDIDVLACPRCGGRLRLLGTIEDPVAIRAILDSLAVSAGARGPRAAGAATREPATLATQRLTDALRRALRRRLFGRPRACAPPGVPLAARNPLTGPLSALYVGARDEPALAPRTVAPR